jgi:hypothetical protein
MKENRVKEITLSKLDYEELGEQGYEYKSIKFQHSNFFYLLVMLHHFELYKQSNSGMENEYQMSLQGLFSS